MAFQYKTTSLDKNSYFSPAHLGPELKTKAMRGASITLISQAINYGMGTIGTIILARILIPHDFGLITMVVSFSLILQNFGGNGLIEVVIQREIINHDQVTSLFWFNVGASFGLMLLFLLSAPLIIWFYKEPLLKPIINVMAITILLGGVSNQHQAILIRNMKFYHTAAYEIAALITSLSIAIVLAIRGWGYWALVARWVASPLIIAGGAWIMCGWRPTLPKRSAGVKPMVIFALTLYGNYLLNFVSRNIDKILIGRYLGSKSLGFYDRAYHLSLMLPNQLVGPLAGVALATFSRLTGEQKKFRETYLAVISTLAFIGMPLSAAMVLIGRDLILLLLGPQWNSSGNIFTVFGFSIGITIIYSTYSWLHLSLGTPNRWLRWCVYSMIIAVLFYVIGIQFGALGVAVAYSAFYYIMIGPALSYAGKPINLTLASIISAIWTNFVAALVAGLLCFLIFYIFESTSSVFSEFNIFIRIIVSALSCLSIYLIIIIILHQSIRPILSFISILREIVFKKSLEN